MIVSNSADSDCDIFLLFLAVDVATTISYIDLTVLPLAEIYVPASKACRGTISVKNYVDLFLRQRFSGPLINSVS